MGLLLKKLCTTRNLGQEREAGGWGTSATEAREIQCQTHPERVFISYLVGHLDQTKVKYCATFHFALGNKTTWTVEWKISHCIFLWKSILSSTLDCQTWQESSCAGKGHMFVDFHESRNIDPFFPAILLNSSDGTKEKQRQKPLPLNSRHKKISKHVSLLPFLAAELN